MRERCSQWDLFEQETMLPDLRPDLRTKLALLLQTLLDGSGQPGIAGRGTDRGGGRP